MGAGKLLLGLPVLLATLREDDDGVLTTVSPTGADHGPRICGQAKQFVRGE